MGASLVSHPQEHGGTFILDTDASGQTIGCVLSQVQDGEEKVIAYGSRALSHQERNYCVTDRELLAVWYFVEYCRQYLLGRKFLVQTDHQAIHWLFSLKEPKDRLARWLETLSGYQFWIEHCPGKKHGNADALSHRQYNPAECDCPLLNEDEELLYCGPCHKCRHRSQTMQSDFKTAEGDHGSIPAGQPKKAVAMVSVETQTDDIVSENSSIILQVGNAEISKSHRRQLVRDKGVQVDHGLKAPKSSKKSRKFGRSGQNRQSGGRPLPVAETSVHNVVCRKMAVADKTPDIQALGNGVTLIDSAAEIRAKQLKDLDIAPIIEWKEKGP